MWGVTPDIGMLERDYKFYPFPASASLDQFHHLSLSYLTSNFLTLLTTTSVEKFQNFSLLSQTWIWLISPWMISPIQCPQNGILHTSTAAHCLEIGNSIALHWMIAMAAKRLGNKHCITWQKAVPIFSATFVTLTLAIHISCMETLEFGSSSGLEIQSLEQTWRPNRILRKKHSGWQWDPELTPQVFDVEGVCFATRFWHWVLNCLDF